MITYRSLCVAIGASLCMLLYGCGQRKMPTPPMRNVHQVVSLVGVNTLGNPFAPAILGEFGDFQCLPCATFQLELLPKIRTNYIDRGMLRFAYFHLPLPVHPQAERAAQAAECAGLQGAFWPMYDQLFADARRLYDPDLVAHAREAGLDVDAFSRCMRGRATEQLDHELRMAKELGLSSTPSFVIAQPDDSGGVMAIGVVAGPGWASAVMSAVAAVTKQG